MSSKVMERSLDEAHENLYYPSMIESGKQHSSEKRTQPQWKMPKASRDTEKKVFISKMHPQDLLGKDSPGFSDYEPKRLKELPKWSFGKAAARPPMAKNKFPETSNDLINALPDDPFKYEVKKPVIGQASRDAAYYQPGFDGFPAGAVSPGPQRYTPANSIPGCRFAHAPNIDKIPPKYTMRPKTKVLESESQTPARVGPGLYPAPEACQPQTRSEKPSLPQWGINKVDRWKDKKQAESGRLWDGMGDRKIQFNRSFGSSPSIGFGTSTRDHAKKIARADTTLDKGPAAFMDKPWKSHPSLPSRKEILKYTDVPTGG